MFYFIELTLFPVWIFQTSLKIFVIQSFINSCKEVFSSGNKKFGKQLVDIRQQNLPKFN